MKRQYRKICRLFFVLILFAVPWPSFVVAMDPITIKMSTTTSTLASGLLDVLLPEFKKDTGIGIKVIAKGTGAAIRDGMEGNVDVIFVHDKAREEKFVAEGFGRYRLAVMHNDFVIIGPPEDPAAIKGLSDAVAAFKKLVLSESVFVSRGDDSGTHSKEQELWAKTKLILQSHTAYLFKKGKKREVVFRYPKGMRSSYISIGQGMGKTLSFADEKPAYTLSDRGTYIKYKYANSPGINLEILCEGDKMLHNPYGVIPVNPERFKHVKFGPADLFARWLVSKKAQTIIGNYKVMGRQLFYPKTR